MVVKKINDNSGDLYVPMTEVTEKRKSLLLSIKDSLLVQEEYEKILQLRAAKAEVLKKIKKGMSSLNSDYASVNKILPNIKNTLQNTEREISILESQLSTSKSKAKSKATSSVPEFKMSGTKKATPTRKKAPVKAKPKAPVKPLTKKERVKNNLKIIEAKLKNL